MSRPRSSPSIPMFARMELLDWDSSEIGSEDLLSRYNDTYATVIDKVSNPGALPLHQNKHAES
jgi:hypothetical protein